MRVNFDDIEDMKETCALDVADRGETSDPNIAELISLSYGSTRNVISAAMKSFRQKWNEMYGED